MSLSGGGGYLGHRGGVVRWRCHHVALSRMRVRTSLGVGSCPTAWVGREGISLGLLDGAMWSAANLTYLVHASSPNMALSVENARTT